MKSSAWYAIIVGALLIVLWLFLLIKGEVPELQTEAWAIAFHITAEAGMALILLIGGRAALGGKDWARPMLYLGLGMLLYSAVNSAGYYAQLGRWGFVALFAAILASALWAILQVAPKIPGKHRRHGR